MDILILQLMRHAQLTGYDVLTYIHKNFDFLFSSGTVYTILYSMERDGLIKAEVTERKRIYSLSKKGEMTLKTIRDSNSIIEDFWSKLLKHEVVVHWEMLGLSARALCISSDIRHARVCAWFLFFPSVVMYASHQFAFAGFSAEYKSEITRAYNWRWIQTPRFSIAFRRSPDPRYEHSWSRAQPFRHETPSTIWNVWCHPQCPSVLEEKNSTRVLTVSYFLTIDAVVSTASSLKQFNYYEIRI